MNKIIYILSFFLFSGYYIGLEIIISLGRTDVSRFYSIPIRIIQLGCMFYLIYKGIKNGLKINSIFFIIFFCFFYFLKVLYTENTPLEDNEMPLKNNWVEYIFYYFVATFLPILAFASFNFKKYAKYIINGIILSSFIFALVTIYIYYDAIGTGVGRISLLIYDDPSQESTISPLALSYGSSLGISLCLYSLFFEKKSFWYRIYLFSVIGVSLVIFFLGSSRGALVAILLSVMCLFLFSNYKNKIIAAIFIFISIPFSFILSEKIGSNLFERTDDALSSGDTSGRNELWEDAWNQFINNPILGGRIEVSGIYPHNMFLEVMMATGIIGMILFCIPFFKSIFNGMKFSKNDKLYLIPLIIFINGLSQNMFSGAIYNMTLLSVGYGIFLSNFNYSES